MKIKEQHADLRRLVGVIAGSVLILPPTPGLWFGLSSIFGVTDDMAT